MSWRFCQPTSRHKEGTMPSRRRAAHRSWLTAILLIWMIGLPTGFARAEIHEPTEIAAHVELMQGHLIDSLENYQLGNTPLAQAHATHPLHEHYRELPASFAQARPYLDRALREAL